MTLKIQTFIYCFDGIEEANSYLSQKLRIKAEHFNVWDADGKRNDVYLYTPGPRADMNNPIVREANGLVLYEDGGLLTKLHNHPVVVEKYADLLGKEVDEFRGVPDGKFFSIFDLEGSWRVATADSVGPADAISHEFVKALSLHERFKAAHPDLIYVFNYVSDSNINILPYSGRKAYLFAIIDRTTGKELSWELVSKMGKNLFVELTDNTVHPLQPGEMARADDETYFVPNKIHVGLKNALEAGERITPKHIVKIYQACRNMRDMDTVSLFFPNYERMLDFLEQCHRRWQNELTQLWSAAHLYAHDDKRFSEMINHHPLNFILHRFRNGQATGGIVKELRELKPRKVLQLVHKENPDKLRTYEKLIKFEKGVWNGSNDNQKESGQEESGKEEGLNQYGYH